MPLYRNLNRDSGVHSFQEFSDRIVVLFNNGKFYEYTNGFTGLQHIENMKNLARTGRGLNGYINKYVKTKYSRKW